MTNEELKKEISKNIQLVFDNEESFAAEFLPLFALEIFTFHMGSEHHAVKFNTDNHGSKTKYIHDLLFEEWKQSLNKNDSNG